MRKGTEVIGLPVLTFDTGETIAEVKEVLFDPEGNRVLGILLEGDGWLRETRAIPFSRIKSIGPDVVIADSAAAMVGADSNEEIARAVRTDRIVRGARAFTENGQDLGEIREVIFDERTGVVSGYVMSGGIFADRFRNKPVMPAPERVRLGKRVIYVPDETATRMAQEANQADGTTERWGRSSLEAAAGAQPGAEQRRAKLRQRLMTVNKERQEKYVIGRPSQYEIRDGAGQLIVGRGQIITPEIADRAYHEALLGLLLLDVELEELVGVDDREK